MGRAQQTEDRKGWGETGSSGEKIASTECWLCAFYMPWSAPLRSCSSADSGSEVGWYLRNCISDKLPMRLMWLCRPHFGWQNIISFNTISKWNCHHFTNGGSEVKRDQVLRQGPCWGWGIGVLHLRTFTSKCQESPSVPPEPCAGSQSSFLGIQSVKNPSPSCSELAGHTTFTFMWPHLSFPCQDERDPEWWVD